MSACSETNEFHKRIFIWARLLQIRAEREPSSRSAFNGGLASGDSGLQLNLEIALSGVSAKVSTTFSPGRKSVEASDSVIKAILTVLPRRAYWTLVLCLLDIRLFMSIEAYEVASAVINAASISDALPFGRLCYRDPNAVSNAIGHAKFCSRSCRAVIRVSDSVS
jgi:hypothetical protein